MAYSDISLLAADNDFIQRTRACVATQGVDDVVAWTNAYQWQMAAMPGFGDKYATAIVNQIPRPGWDPSVISDGDILSAVQTLPLAPPARAPGNVISLVAKPDPMGPRGAPNTAAQINITGEGFDQDQRICIVDANGNVLVYASTTNYFSPTSIMGYINNTDLPYGSAVVAVANRDGKAGAGIRVNVFDQVSADESGTPEGTSQDT